MSAEPELVAARRGAVLVLRLNRPDSRNALTLSLMRDLTDAVVGAEADPDTRAVVITGTGDRAFCAGADLKAVAAGGTGETVPDDFMRLLDGGTAVPVVAAVNGVAVGGGCELALGADLVVAADTASFGLPEVKRGLFAGSGAATVATKLPLGVALELTLTGERIDAQRAYELGFVNRVVPQAEVLDAALDLAALVAANAPLGLAASKEIVRKSATGAPDARERLRHWQSVVFASEDAREGATAFLEKRSPSWRGR